MCLNSHIITVHYFFPCLITNGSLKEAYHLCQTLSMNSTKLINTINIAATPTQTVKVFINDQFIQQTHIHLSLFNQKNTFWEIKEHAVLFPV